MSLTQLYLHYYNNPETALGKWLRQSSLKRAVTFLMLFLILTFFPISQWIKHYQQLDKLQQTQQSSTQTLNEQHKILQHLQQKNHTARLSPEKTTALLPINQKLQQLAKQYSKLTLHFSSWEQQNLPTLHIQFQGYFKEIHQFLTALLPQMPQLMLSTLHIEKSTDSEFSIQGKLIFQFKSEP